MEFRKPVDTHTESTTDLLLDGGHRFGTHGYKCSRRTFVFISLCAIGFLFMYVSKLYKWTSTVNQFKSTHKAMTVDEVILSLSWPTSASNFTSPKTSSSAQHSVVKLEQPRAKYCAGDTLNVLVEMRNLAGHPKTHGGDFIIARIFSPKLQAFASGNVTDLLNGSYRVRFHLFWPGEVYVSVRLIHSSEVVQIYQRDYMKHYGSVVFKGTFISGGKMEISRCAFHLDADKPLCEYRKKETGEYHACYKPQTLPCNALTITKSIIPPVHQLTKEETALLAKKNTGNGIKNSFNSVTVINCTDMTDMTHRPTEKCVAGMNSPFPAGYFCSKKWSPSYCQIGPFLSEDAITRCLKGKTVHLFGDSTMRQWVVFLERKLKDLRNTDIKADLQFAVDTVNNITVRWVRHFLPWIGSGPGYIKATIPIAEMLDRIADAGRQKDAIVAIGLGQHFRPYPLEFFIRRLQNIRRAVLRLQARNPQTTVIIKLENIRDFTKPHFNNWYGYMQNLAQRKVFAGMKVGLVDAWDMTVGPSSFTVHANDVIISNEVALALSFHCHYT